MTESFSKKTFFDVFLKSLSGLGNALIVPVTFTDGAPHRNLMQIQGLKVES